MLTLIDKLDDQDYGVAVVAAKGPLACTVYRIPMKLPPYCRCQFRFLIVTACDDGQYARAGVFSAIR